MAKNGSDKRKRPTKKSEPSNKKSSANSTKKAATKKTDTRVPTNVRGLEKTPVTKTETKNVIKQILSPQQKKYKKASSLSAIQKIITKEKRLRVKGRFISKEAQNKILFFAETLDKKGVRYNMADIINTPEFQKKILIIKDETPDELFYWNVQTLVEKKKLGEDVNYLIKDFDGSIMYKGKSESKAALTLQKANKKIDNLRKVMKLKEGDEIDNSGFSIPIYETTRDGKTLNVEIDLGGLKSKVSPLIWDKYKTML